MSLLDRIKHHSASSLYVWEECSAYWALERIKGRRQGVSAAAHRGNATEAGLAKFLAGEADCDEAAHQATVEFDRLTALSPDPSRDKEREALAGFVEQGIAALKDYGKPTHQQREIKYSHADVKLPFIGFVDFDFENHGILVDLKTTHRLPSSISMSHARQVALYKAATSDNLSARVAYVTPKKAAVYELENHQEHLRSMIEIAQRVERFLSLFDDEDEMMSVLVPRYSSFLWNSPAARQAGFEVFGF